MTSSSDSLMNLIVKPTVLKYSEPMVVLFGKTRIFTQRSCLYKTLERRSPIVYYVAIYSM